MSVKVDVEQSTAARTEGNASFKKGRWNEAIGHYTKAIVFNPQDGLGYTNRAAAYLKLDKWKDVERDCTTAIGLPNGKTNLKAHYRRSLARKVLGDLTGALEDINAVLAAEPTNETAREELVEMEEVQRKENEAKEAKTKKGKALPPSPTLQPVTAESSHSAPAISSEVAGNASPEASLAASPTVKLSPNAIEPVKTSFADLKKGRQAGRRTFTTTLPVPSSEVPLVSPSALTLEKASITDLTPATTSGPADTPLPLLDPTIPGSALAFISSIRIRSAKATWPIIADLAKRPESIGKMLDNILEPDQLALILVRLQDTLDLDVGTKEERMAGVKAFVTGLRRTNRWSMTVIMLSIKERQMGQDIWESVGGTGDWTRTA